MTREEAESESARLCAEHPNRRRYRWFAQECGQRGWVVARVPLPRGARVIDPLKTTVEAKPKPPLSDDPRTSIAKHTGGTYI
jgi:hypothetical protein